jgi:hypothetical protein
MTASATRCVAAADKQRQWNDKRNDKQDRVNKGPARAEKRTSARQARVAYNHPANGFGRRWGGGGVGAGRSGGGEQRGGRRRWWRWLTATAAREVAEEGRERTEARAMTGGGGSGGGSGSGSRAVSYS